MSVVKETLIFCDGGDGCPEDGPYSCADARNETAAMQRASYGSHTDGWLYRKGKDYCPACAKRLFNWEPTL